MQSVDRLVAEHDFIERVLTLLEKAIVSIEEGKSLPADFPAWAARFFQQFADECHHAKEEDVLFPVLKERGVPEEGGPIGVMMHEHILGRNCVGQMREASQVQPLNARKFSEAAQQYIPLLRQHIFKENNILFRMAAQVMSDSDDAQATRRFAQVEQERGLVGLQDSFSAEVTRWEQELIEK